MNAIDYKNEFGQLHRDDGLPAVEWDDGGKDWWVNGKLHREDGPAVVYANGYKAWFKNGERHRDGGLPAIEGFVVGYKAYWVNGKLHREDGPAVEYANGDKSWYINGELHRDGGPAIEDLYRKLWYKNGQRHRDFGFPAVEWGNGTAEWYIKGQRVLNGKKRYEENRIRAQKKIYFWWIQICYDLEHPSGCGQRMAQRNLKVFESMMSV